MIAAATARGYVEKHTDADRASISVMGDGPVGRRSRSHWTFSYREQSSGEVKVVHLISRADVVDDRLFESQTGELRNLPGAAPQVVIQAASDVVLIVRDYVELLSGVPATGQIQFSVARDYLLQILRTLAQWHSRGVFHGDLRPENVAVSGRNIQFIDFFARLPVEELGSDRLDYVAPELRDGGRRGSIAGDVYSFARLAVELLRPFRGDFRNPIAGQLERQLSWLADHCYVMEPEKRPAASEVLARFFPEEVGRSGDALKMALGLLRAPKRALGGTQETSAFGTLGGRFRAHTEFRILSDRKSILGRLLKEVAVDNFSARAHIGDHDNNRDWKSRSSLGSLVEKSSLGDNIDSRWRTSIHRLHFGHGFDRDHETRTNPRPVDPVFVARDTFYDWHLEESRDIRKKLLDNNDFLYTSDVVDRLAQRVPDAQASDVTALRHLGAILAVPDHDRWLYPAFQFNGAGEIDPTIQLVNDLLRHSSGLPEDEWSTLALWCLPQPALDGLSLRSALLRSTFDEVAASLRPEFLDEPPFWFNAPQEIRTMAIVEHTMRRDACGSLQGEAGEEILWDKSGSDLILRWSADSSLARTLESFGEFVTDRPSDSLGALRPREGSVQVLPSAEVLASARNGERDLDLLRLDLDRFAFVWEAVSNARDDLPAADITAIFHPSQAEKVEVMIRRTGTQTVRECAKVAIQSVVLHREAS